MMFEMKTYTHTHIWIDWVRETRRGEEKRTYGEEKVLHITEELI